MVNVADIVREVEGFGIRCREAGGEVWYDVYRGKPWDDVNRVRLGMLSRVIQENKGKFIEYLWRRDHGDAMAGKVGKDIIAAAMGKGFRGV